MKIIVWVFTVLPFVTIVWLYDITSLACIIVANKYYIFAYSRSSYLQERALLDAYVEASNVKPRCTYPGYN